MFSLLKNNKTTINLKIPKIHREGFENEERYKKKKNPTLEEGGLLGYDLAFSWQIHLVP